MITNGLRQRKEWCLRMLALLVASQECLKPQAACFAPVVQSHLGRFSRRFSYERPIRRAIEAQFLATYEIMVRAILEA
jgi:hypothetical protein